MAVSVTRLPLRITPDPSRVITRFFLPGDKNRVRDIIARSLSVPEGEIETLANELIRTFRPKHPDLVETLADHFEKVRDEIPRGVTLTEARKTWIGACFTMEYAIESVALFNPSIVPGLYQDGVRAGGVRFLMSLRATGEGHISVDRVPHRCASTQQARCSSIRLALTAGR